LVSPLAETCGVSRIWGSSTNSGRGGSAPRICPPVTASTSAAVSPLGDFGGRVMPGHLPGCEPEIGMPRPGKRLRRIG